MKIKSFEAKNSKGLQNIAFELSEIEVIQGKNGVGKTSILDAVCWVLYNTDCEGSFRRVVGKRWRKYYLIIK